MTTIHALYSLVKHRIQETVSLIIILTIYYLAEIQFLEAQEQLILQDADPGRTNSYFKDSMGRTSASFV